MLDYRDASGLFDRDSHHPDPRMRALGAEPEDCGLAAHRRQVGEVIDECRAAILLAEVVRNSPSLGQHRPDPALAALAQRPLGDLDAELGRLTGDDYVRGLLGRGTKARAKDLARAISSAEEAEARLAGARRHHESRSQRRWRRADPESATAVAVAAAAVDQAHQAARAAAARLEHSQVTLAGAGDDSAERRHLLSAAIRLRQTTLASELLGDPPAWLRADVAVRAQADETPDPQRLAEAYGQLASHAERAGTTDAPDLLGALGPEPTNGAGRSAWLGLHDQLGLDSPTPGREAGFDVAL